jgi:hypothetical protein
MVTGKMQMDNDAPFKFVQTFHLLPNGQGGYFCKKFDLVLFVGANDIFRLMMHDQSAPGESD